MNLSATGESEQILPQQGPPSLRTPIPGPIVPADRPIQGPPQPGLPGGQLALCPYCGHRQSGRLQCERCKGLFEPLSRQATQNHMGPWQIRDETNPFRPGFSFDKLRELVAKSRIGRDTIIRGPSTRQFWTLACNTPGVAVLLGECHSCHARVDPEEYMCKACGAVLSWAGDRQYLGLAPIKLLPGQATPGEVASSGMAGAVARAAMPRLTESGDEPAQNPPPNADGLSETEPVRIRTDDAPRPVGGLRIVLVAILGAAALGGAVAAAMIWGPSDAASAPAAVQPSE